MSESEKTRDLLAVGPNLADSKTWKKINAKLGSEGLLGMTSKLVIGNHDVYVKTSWFGRSIVRIDITLSSGRGSLSPDTQDDSLDQTRFDLSKSWVEDSCRMASNLLQTGNVGINTILDSWLGVEGYPQGYCPQLGGIMKGPLHAVAVLIKNRLYSWYTKIDAQETIMEREVAARQALEQNIAGEI